MSQNQTANSRMRAYLRFIFAVIWFFLARGLAGRGATGVATDAFVPVVEQAMLVFLLLLGYAGIGFWLDREAASISEQGLPRRTGWLGEAGLGLAAGWSLAVVCVLLLVAGGGIAIVLLRGFSASVWLAIELDLFALLALAEEIAFRGYGFQQLERALGSLGAALGFAVFYAIVQSFQPGSNRASIAVSVALSLVLSTAYLRSRALWVSWGINFGWKASRALLFGLAISGVTRHSPVVQGNPMGPFWLTGGGFGLDGSWVSCAVLLAAIPVVYRLTRELDYVYNAPVIVPGGIPVDVSAAGQRQHDAATRPVAAAAPTLVQILPAIAPAPFRPGEQDTK
jgi:membrane protease YdiL (CAAX protease family)